MHPGLPEHLQAQHQGSVEKERAQVDVHGVLFVQFCDSDGGFGLLGKFSQHYFVLAGGILHQLAGSSAYRKQLRRNGDEFNPRDMRYIEGQMHVRSFASWKPSNSPSQTGMRAVVDRDGALEDVRFVAPSLADQQAWCAAFSNVCGQSSLMEVPCDFNTRDVILGRNPCFDEFGLDVGAVISAKLMPRQGEDRYPPESLRPGLFLAAIDKQGTALLSFDETAALLHQAPANATMLLCMPIPPSLRETRKHAILTVRVDNAFPTRMQSKMPRKVGLFLGKPDTPSDRGIQVIETESGATCCFWFWEDIVDCTWTAEVRTRRPDETDCTLKMWLFAGPWEMPRDARA